MQREIAFKKFKGFPNVKFVGFWVDAQLSQVEKNSIGFFERVAQCFITRNYLRLAIKNKQAIIKLTQSVSNLPLDDETKKFAIGFHKRIIHTLDNSPELPTIKADDLPPTIFKLHKVLVETREYLENFELEFRLKFFPDQNEIILTYHEMKEIRSCLKDWERAEEQSDIYSK